MSNRCGANAFGPSVVGALLALDARTLAGFSRSGAGFAVSFGSPAIPSGKVEGGEASTGSCSSAWALGTTVLSNSGIAWPGGTTFRELGVFGSLPVARGSAPLTTVKSGSRETMGIGGISGLFDGPSGLASPGAGL